MNENEEDKQGQAGQLFENFIQATTCKGTLQAFNILTRQLELDTQDYRHFYSKLKSKVTNWKAKALWNKLDKRIGHKEYNKGKACLNTNCLIIGGGPCGLRTAIELSCLGAKVVVVEKRDTFSRNNVLHLWPYTIHDLRCLGAKKFYGKFCAGSIDHISIWQLQLMLFKIALLHGIEIHVNVEFAKLLEPPEDQENQKIGWRAEFLPQDHPLSEYEFDVIIGADGRRNTLEGFRRKEFRGKLAIAITANFINRNTTAEAKVEEISGVAFIFNQKFFQDLKEETGIDLENIVYYKDSTHYFVMTAKKQSLLDKGVIINDYVDAEALLSAENVDQDNLQSYAREAADFATNYQLPSLDFAINHYGLPDVAMFDFTSMYASENAALVRERHGHLLLVALVGDSLLEPFWPMGTGCARGFLAAFDTAWMVRSWSQGNPPLEVIAEREGLYRLLPQTTPENISKNFDQYTIDPATRYPNLNSNCVRSHQVKHLFFTNELLTCPLQRDNSIRRSVGLTRHESDIRPNKLLTWCQKQTEGYQNVNVTDLTKSWKNGLALCAIIHRFRPELIEFSSLNEEDAVTNNQLAYDIAEREFGITPITTGKEMASTEEPDKLSMVLYLSKFYELFRGSPLRPVDTSCKNNGKNQEDYLSRPSNLIFNNYLNLTLPRKRIPKVETKSEENDVNKRRKKEQRNFDEPASVSNASLGNNECSDTKEVINQNKVKSMASQLLAKFEENAPNTSLRRTALALSDVDSAASGLCPCDTPPVNPRFAKPVDPTPCQPQVEPKRQVLVRAQPLFRPPTLPKPRPAPASREPKPVAKADDNPERADDTDSLMSACSALALTGILQRLQHIEEKVQQKRAQSLSNREFHKKNIKEKAAHLASLFASEDFPQNKLSSPGLSHYPSKTPNFDSQVLPPCPSSAASSESLSKKVLTLASVPVDATNKIKIGFPDPTQMTVGKVSHGVGALAAVLVNLYMSDHRPKSKSPELTSMDDSASSLLSDPFSSSPDCISPPPKGSLRKEFPANIGGSDICYFCKKRVYVVERLSAEGHFFHRECFKCAFCSTSLRLGNYVFNMEEDKFYCQPHFMHSFSNNKTRKRRPDSRSQEEKTWKREAATAAEVTTDSPYSDHSSSDESSPGIMTSLFRKSVRWPLEVTRDLLAIPSRLSNWTHGVLQDARRHVRDNEQSYVYTYELLSVSLPFLYMLLEMLTHMYYEAGPSLQSIIQQPNGLKWYTNERGNYVNERENGILWGLGCSLNTKGCQLTTRLEDEPISPKKSRSDSNSFFYAIKRRLSSVSTEWKSVTIEPEEETAENNIMAVRVMVHSDNSSSDNEEETYSERTDSSVNINGKQTDATSHTGQTVPSSKLRRWKRLLSDKNMFSKSIPSITVTKPACVSREGLPSLLSSPDDEVFCKSVAPESFSNSAIRKNEVLENRYHGVPTYRPHHKALLNSSQNNLQREHTTRYLTSDKHIPHLKGEHEGYRDVIVYNPHSESSMDSSDVFEEDYHADQRLKENLTEHDSNLKSQSLKKLVLSQEEKTNLLDWNIGNPKQRVGNNREKAAPQVEPDPGGESGAKGKSAFSILSDIIRRSLRRSTNSVSESTTPTLLNKEKSGGYFDFSTSFFRRRGSNTEHQTNPNGSEMNSQSQHLSSGWRIHPQNDKQNTSTNTKIEDRMPKMLEKITIKENPPSGANQDIPFRSRRNSFFSSLKLKKSENPLYASSTDTWSVFGSFRRNVNEKKTAESLQTNIAHKPPPKPSRDETDTISTSNRTPPTRESTAIPTGNQTRGGRMAMSENCCNSSDDEESTSKSSSSFKATRAIKDRRKIEKEARQKAKQEELKRLHKAQTIQRQLQELEERQRALEIQGVKLEKALRGESDSGTQDEAQLLHEWFQVAFQRNKLSRYESELLCVAKELDLEDQHARLEQTLREKMVIEPSLKSEKDVADEEIIFAEMMRVVEQRDQLVTQIEEQRLRQNSEENKLSDIPIISK
ncbi:F-actin-monooxygenase MICAL2 [Pelobates fuscus]|uniref:F-actin-monooxygenase MICAL2 n=1 Tax=Pelobates fuscus TaxID=191477 RepID=UPI002FE4C349